MHRQIADAGGLETADQNHRGSSQHGIGWTGAGCHIGNARRRLTADEHIDCPGAGNRSANVRLKTVEERAGMQVGYPGSGQHGWQFSRWFHIGG
jgi:hypothetical protein